MLSRPEWIAALARASAEELATALAAAAPIPPHRRLRGPEVGLTMLRGRAGGDGAPFNLGEATLTRCSVALEGGPVGHAWRLGRDCAAAEAAALLDALFQAAPERAGPLLAPIRARLAAEAERTARRAAATEVRFATLAAMR
ncbi:phosphonate C-P lyase system protein PhnG [Rubritepida flocculans]|uniref:phosphonate C-P lyase system protein PhnG n=1 Tax=Rubritepida flocculans TaxID=182403 RepID=UPI000400E99B|nr:phosphonate C-P lyase system protein PhnG [Rubritepida flocculans]